MKKFLFIIMSVISMSSLQGTKWLYCVTEKDTKFNLFTDLIKKNNLDIALIKNDLSIYEIQADPEPVAEKKAKDAFDILHKPLIVDDSGFVLDAFLPRPFPGAYTKGVMESFGIETLLQLCEIKKNYNLTIYSYVTYIDAYYNPRLFKGEIKGVLVRPSYSLEGLPKRPEFWFDYFIPEGSSKTYGQLFDDGELEEFNYRARAFKKFLEFYKDYTF